MALKIRRATILVLVGAVVVGVAGYGATKWFEVSRYPQKFATASIGDSKEAVIRPPVWWVTGFDREGRVVWKPELNSP